MARPVIPIVAAPAADRDGDPRGDDGGASCAAAEPYALMVLGDSMRPEFDDGDIIVVEPEGLAAEGSYVVAWWADEWWFRQLARSGDGWQLRALDPRHPPVPIPDLAPVRGVVIQKSKPGRRRGVRRYVDC